jgi:hypothetical protein
LIFSLPNYLPFYTLDSWFHNTVFSASASVLTNDLNQEDCYLGPKV